MKTFLILLFAFVITVPLDLEAQLQSAAPIDTTYRDTPRRLNDEEIVKIWMNAGTLWTLSTHSVDMAFNGYYDTTNLKSDASSVSDSSSQRFALTFLSPIYDVRNVDYFPVTTINGADSAGIVTFVRKVNVWPGNWSVSSWTHVDSVGVRCSPDTIPQIVQTNPGPSFDSVFVGKYSTGYIQFKHVIIDEGDDFVSEGFRTKMDRDATGRQRTFNGVITQEWRRSIR